MHAIPQEVPGIKTNVKTKKAEHVKSYIGDLFERGVGAPRADSAERQGLQRGTEYTGVLKADVETNQRLNVVPILEVQSLRTARYIHDSSGIDCNFIFVQPESIETLSNRIIRTRPGSETKESLSNKMN